MTVSDGRESERGQSTVEFALILPLVMIVVFAVVQIGLVVVSHIAVSHTARELGRALAADPSADVGQLTESITTLGVDRLAVHVTFDTALVTNRQVVHVTVVYDVPRLVKAFDVVLGDLEVRATAVFLVETRNG